MNYDVIIVGAGIAGLTTACALAQQTRLSIAVVDSQAIKPNWNSAHYHHRVSAIALSSKHIFQRLGAWPIMTAKRVSPFQHIAVWDQATQANLTFSAADIATAQLGYIIENNVMQDALLARVLQHPQITLLAPLALTKLEVTADQVALHGDQRVLTSQLVIAADGANSWVRQQLGMSVTAELYGHDAIVATVRHTLPHQKTARQVFLAGGPLAFLPLDDEHQCSIVWSMPPDQAQVMLALDDDTFGAELARAFSNRLGDTMLVGKRFSFTLRKQRSDRYIATRVALVGDAAHTVHPLAGQGLNVGLLDAAALAEVIIEAARYHRDIGDKQVLRRYERWRKGENGLMLSGIDSIKAIFCSGKQTTKTLRSLGLSVTQQLPLLKNIFTRRAVGLHDGLPVLAKEIIS